MLDGHAARAESHLEHTPGPEFLTGALEALHTHHARLPRHAEAGQLQLFGPLQDVLPFALVVDVMAVDPQPGEGLRAWRFRRSLRASLVVVAIVPLEVFMRVISEPVDSRQHAHIARAALTQVKAQLGDQAGVPRPAQLGASTTTNGIAGR